MERRVPHGTPALGDDLAGAPAHAALRAGGVLFDPVAPLPRAARAAWWAVALLALFAGMSGRDVVGRDLHLAISGSGAISALQLALFVWSIVLMHRAHRTWEHSGAHPLSSGGPA
jgi:hypothetical protein